jgi:hypothetical protein
MQEGLVLPLNEAVTEISTGGVAQISSVRSTVSGQHSAHRPSISNLRHFVHFRVNGFMPIFTLLGASA